MNRYVAVNGLYEKVEYAGGSVANWFVVDLVNATSSYGSVVADCGDSQTMANKVAQALNALDGGPLS